MTAASGSAGTGVLRHCELCELSRTAFVSKSNRSCNRHLTTYSQGDERPAYAPSSSIIYTGSHSQLVQLSHGGRP